MGSFLSKKRQLKRVHCTGTKMQGAENMDIIKRCSTFGVESNVVLKTPTKVSSVVKVVSESPKQTPTQNKRAKYDPVYALWKNAFEDNKLRSPRKVSPIKDESAHHQNITGAIAGQLTPKGFPSYTELRKILNNNKGNNDDENSQTDVCRRLSFRMALNCPLPGETVEYAQIRPSNGDGNISETTQEVFYENAISNSKKSDEINENGPADTNETLIESLSSSMEYTPKFLAMVANEKAMVVQKFFKKHVSKIEGCKRSKTMSPKRTELLVLRQSRLPTSRRSCFEEANVNASSNSATEELSTSYNIYKDYYFL